MRMVVMSCGALLLLLLLLLQLTIGAIQHNSRQQKAFVCLCVRWKKEEEDDDEEEEEGPPHAAGCMGPAPSIR